MSLSNVLSSVHFWQRRDRTSKSRWRLNSQALTLYPLLIRVIGVNSKISVKELFRILILVSPALFLLSACGGGGGGNGGGGEGNPLWVTIDTTSSIVQISSVDLHGEAYCDNCPPSEVALGYCPPIQGPLSSAIDVTWKNLTTGETGNTIHGISGSCSCLFSYCYTSYSHQWVAYSVPLVIGGDLIEVKASNLSGASATDTVTITRIPASPVELVAVAGKEEVTLNWNNVAGATSYNLYWSTTANLTMDTATKIAGVASPYVHTGLTDDVTYYYFVTAVIGGFESPPSQTVFATPGWQTEVIAPTTATTDNWATSIAMDSAGHAHVHYAFDECAHYSTLPPNFTYCDSYNYYNNYITDASGSWTGQQVGHSPYVDANIAVDSGDTVHIGYADLSGITHEVYVSGAWNSEVIDAAGWCKSSFALDSANKSHFAYWAISPPIQELRYATNIAGAWVHGAVDTFTQDIGCSVPGSPLSITVDLTGTAHLAYAGRYPDYGLKYATNQGGTWISTTIDTGYITELSTAVDANGRTHITYSDNNHYIKYAHQDALGTWVINVIDNSGSTGYPSLALDASGIVHLSYISGLNGWQLIYATNSTGTWRFLPIDGADYADTALALDVQGKVHLSYFSSGNLKYATNR